jgi:hypothetical protein
MSPHFRIATRDDLPALTGLIRQARDWAEKTGIKQTISETTE